MKPGRKEKYERNKLIVSLIQKGWSYGKVAKEMGFKSRGTVQDIVKRHLKNKDVRDLSTGK